MYVNSINTNDGVKREIQEEILKIPRYVLDLARYLKNDSLNM